MHPALSVVTATLAMACRFGFDDSARLGSDASIDAALADSSGDAPLATRTVSFGDRPSATHPGVTTDTFLNEVVPDEVNGGVADLSLYGPDGTRNFVLLRFDVSALPAATTVTGARLELVVRPTGDLAAGPVEVYALAEAWDEATASWVFRLTSTLWSTAGGTRGALVASLTEDGLPGPLTIDLAPDAVQRWVDDAAQNHGLALTTPIGSMHAHLESRESVSLEERPLLILEVSP